MRKAACIFKETSQEEGEGGVWVWVCRPLYTPGVPRRGMESEGQCNVAATWCRCLFFKKSTHFSFNALMLWTAMVVCLFVVVLFSLHMHISWCFHSVCFRLEGIQYPYHLYISPSARPGTNGPDRPFQCPTCGVRFTRIQNLKQHMLIHSGRFKQSKETKDDFDFGAWSNGVKALVWNFPRH